MMFTSSASTSSSDVSTLGAFTHRRAGNSKSTMKIELDNYFTGRVYTSSASVSGHVNIAATKDIFFDKIQILLLGTSVTRMEGMHAANRTAHTFLKLEMPIADSSYPVPRVYEAGQTYTVPFHFVVPSQLTINACNHNIDSQFVQDSHLLPPPSMGAWDGRDDFSPDMTTVEYSVVARLLRDDGASGKRDKIMEATHPIRVLPAYPEQAPLDITTRDRTYIMSKTKSLRKSILSGKVGRVTVSAKQPRAAMLSPDGKSASGTTAELELAFEPSMSQAQPPTITSITSKITSITYYCSGPINSLPNMGEWMRAFGADPRGSYPTTTTLPSAPIDEVRWQQVARPRMAQDQAESASESDHSVHGIKSAPKGTKNGPSTYHAARLLVPIELPTHKKMFVPTFHSCIASRAYVLWLSVTLSSGSASSTVTVGVPLQVGVQSSTAADALGLPTFEAAIEEAEADADAYMLRLPRSQSPYRRDIGLDGHTLPGYAELMGPQAVAAS